MKFQVKWGPDIKDGFYDIQGVLKEIQECAYGTCREWEDIMWNNIHIGDFIVELLKGRTVQIPYQGEGDLPDVLTITPLVDA